MRRILAFAVLLLVVCCAREQKVPESTQTTATADDTPRDGGTLVRRLDTDVVGLNPIIASSRYDRYVEAYLFTPVVQIDKNLQPAPGLAEEWEISDDGLLYTFKLNEKATFSDGTPVRASDVVFTLRKIVDPAAEALQVAGAFEFLDLARTRAVDDHTVQVGFKQPLASQLIRFNDVMVLPEHVYGKGDFRKDFNIDRVVGSGPYKLVRRVPNREVVMERRADYWDDRPLVQSVVFKVINEHGTAWNALKRGELDETLITSDTWVREHTNPELNKTIDFQRFYTRNYNNIIWNNRNAIFRDKRVRKAMAMCMPVEAIVRDVYHGTARAMTGHFVPEEWAYNPNVQPIRYDPAGARRLLEEAGWTDRNGDGLLEKNGKPFTFDLIIMTGNPITKQVGQMVQSELKAIGVGIEISLLDGATAIERLIAGNYEAIYMGWDLDPDPDPYAMFHSSQTHPHGQNFAFYSNPEADRIMEEARRVLDQGKRKELYHRLHQILADDQPYCWLIQASAKWALNRRVRNVEVSRGMGYFLWYPGELGWWLADTGTKR
jgi:peptide/nickel transport system substrate-binding protein